MAGIEEGFLVSTPLSPLYSQSPISIPIRTSRQQLPLPPNPSDSDIHPEHATFSTVLTTSAHGTIVLRLLHAGVIAELLSLSYQVTPIRFVFPAAVLPNLGLFLTESEVLHVLAVTTSGSLYRLVVSVDGRNLWQSQSDVVCSREYHIVNFPEGEKPLVHVEGTHSVTIALPNASILRLEASSVGDDGQEGECREPRKCPDHNFVIRRRMDGDGFPPRFIPHVVDFFPAATVWSSWQWRHYIHGEPSLANRSWSRLDAVARPYIAAVES